MLKKFVAIAAVALAALCFSGTPARAQDGPLARQYLSYGFDYGAAAYGDKGTPDAYNAALYAYYAEYFASIGDYYNAAVIGEDAANFALADFNATGDPYAYDANYLLSLGAMYAYYAYLGY